MRSNNGSSPRPSNNDQEVADEAENRAKTAIELATAEWRVLELASSALSRAIALRDLTRTDAAATEASQAISILRLQIAERDGDASVDELAALCNQLDQRRRELEAACS